MHNTQTHAVTDSGVVKATYFHSIFLGRPIQDLQNQMFFTQYVLKHYQKQFTEVTQALLAGKQALEDLEMPELESDASDGQDLFYKGRSSRPGA